MLSVRGNWWYDTIYDNAKRDVEWPADSGVAWQVEQFMYWAGQLQRRPNGYDNYCDLEGERYISSKLLEEYTKKRT